MRDMTGKQFLAALKRYGMRNEGFLGYVDVGHGCSICRHNAGENFRAQLAYLIREQERIRAEYETADETEMEIRHREDLAS